MRPGDRVSAPGLSAALEAPGWEWLGVGWGRGCDQQVCLEEEAEQVSRESCQTAGVEVGGSGEPSLALGAGLVWGDTCRCHVCAHRYLSRVLVSTRPGPGFQQVLWPWTATCVFNYGCNFRGRSRWGACPHLPSSLQRHRLGRMWNACLRSLAHSNSVTQEASSTRGPSGCLVEWL